MAERDKRAIAALNLQCEQFFVEKHVNSVVITVYEDGSRDVSCKDLKRVGDEVGHCLILDLANRGNKDPRCVHLYPGTFDATEAPKEA